MKLNNMLGAIQIIIMIYFMNRTRRIEYMSILREQIFCKITVVLIFQRLEIFLFCLFESDENVDPFGYAQNRTNEYEIE